MVTALYQNVDNFELVAAFRIKDVVIPTSANLHSRSGQTLRFKDTILTKQVRWADTEQLVVTPSNSHSTLNEQLANELVGEQQGDPEK